MKRKNIIFWIITAGLLTGLAVGFFLINSVPENQRPPARVDSKKTDNEQASRPVSVSKTKIPQTRLDLELKGTMTTDDSQQLAVILKIKERKQILVKEGDTIDSAVVRKIMKEKVLLWVNDRLEILLLKHRHTRSAKENGEDLVGFEHTAAVTWSDIDALSENLWDIAKQIRVFPDFAKGHLDGFRVFGMKEDHFFYTKLGLRNGDIVSGVNGRKIKSLKDIPNIYDVFEQLESTGTMEIEIKRDQNAGKIKVLIE